jgi:hypothetical protein
VSELCPGQSSKYKNEQRAITLKLVKADAWLIWTAHLANKIYLQSVLFISLVLSYLCPGQYSKCKNEWKAITPKLRKQGYVSLALHFCLMGSIYLLIFLLITHMVSELCPGQSPMWTKWTKGNNYKNWKRHSNGSFALLMYPMRSIYLKGVLFISLFVSELCPWQN